MRRLRWGWAMLLWLAWMLLQGELSVGMALLGLLLAAAVAFWLGPPRASAQGLRWKVCLHLLARVLVDILIANFVVATQIVFKAHRLRPAYLELPLRLQDETRIATLAAIISLTPGSLAVDFDAARGVLCVHALDAPDPAALLEGIRTRYEALLLEVFA